MNFYQFVKDNDNIISEDQESKQIFRQIYQMKKIINQGKTQSKLVPLQMIGFSYINSKLNQLAHNMFFYGIIAMITRRIFFTKYNVKINRQQSFILDLVTPLSISNYFIFFEYKNYNQHYLQNLQGHNQLDQIQEDHQYNQLKKNHIKQYESKFYTNSQFWH